jgi:hypothetical protein
MNCAYKGEIAPCRRVTKAQGSTIGGSSRALVSPRLASGKVERSRRRDEKSSTDPPAPVFEFAEARPCAK